MTAPAAPAHPATKRAPDGAFDGAWDKSTNGSSSLVTDHLFTAPAGRWWDRCSACGLSEAAHEGKFDYTKERA